jgi:hypothetical protein
MNIELIHLQSMYLETQKSTESLVCAGHCSRASGPQWMTLSFDQCWNHKDIEIGFQQMKTNHLTMSLRLTQAKEVRPPSQKQSTNGKRTGVML